MSCTHRHSESVKDTIRPRGSYIDETMDNSMSFIKVVMDFHSSCVLGEGMRSVSVLRSHVKPKIDRGF